jgi:hypothetical protein
MHIPVHLGTVRGAITSTISAPMKMPSTSGSATIG